MFRTKARQERRAEAQTAQAATRHTTGEAIQELFTSESRRTLHARGRTVAGSRARVSVTLQLEGGPVYTVRDAMSFESKYSDFKISLDIRGTRTLQSLDRALGVEKEFVHEIFASAMEFKAWLESPASQDVSIDKAWVYLDPR